MPSLPKTVDICVVGSGILGTATAYHVAKLNPHLKIAIVDVDPSGRFSSSQRNAGGVRAFWKSSINRALSLDSIAFFRQHASEVGLNPCGYLWLHPQDHPIETEIVTFFAKTPTPITVYDAHEPIPHIPWDFKRDDLSCISFHSEAGILNPDLLRSFLLSETQKKCGARFIRVGGWSATRLEPTPDHWKVWLQEGPPQNQLETFFTQPHLLSNASSTAMIEATQVVIALGAWSWMFLKPWRTLPYTCQPIARHIAFIDAPKAASPKLPMVVDPSGVYFHPEGGHLLVGYGDKTQPPGFDFSYSEETFFLSTVWPILYERSPVFEACKHLEGWAGLYSYSPDQDGILGEVVGHPGLYQIHSFTGRGVMVSIAAGRALAELLCTGKFQTLDCSALSEFRFQPGQPKSTGEPHHI